MTINCLGTLVSLDRPRVMGILNLTPDSFYDGGKYQHQDPILHQVSKMLEEGASFIDLGAYSSRPGAAVVSEEEELRRLVPVVDLLLENFPGILLSIDTFRSEVARQALDRGASMINDISGGRLDTEMMKTIGSYKAPYILMHMKGSPQDMQTRASYEDLIGEIAFYFSEQLAKARTYGINDCILDPGFGFAKNTDQNYTLLRELDKISIFGYPLLVGLSRKSMIYKPLHITADQALNGSTALHMIALAKGAKILRVHDVAEAVECIALHEALEKKY